MKKICCLFLLLTLATLYGQEQYTVTFEGLPEKAAAKPKPILIKVYTDWCAVCKIQDKKIENDKELQDLLSDKIYYLTFNAETTKNILFNDKEYNYIPQGAGNGYHELSVYLTEGKQSYPCWVLFSSKYEVLGVYNGLLKNSQLKELLKKQ
ncbi:thioredoxin family protein [Flavobacterium salilacus subsp. salilacus]|uniref:thioredoxin family protein n=1 Tax=Flavobacterium TaxID=237 RepID=UPI00107513D4|nr:MULTISPECIES: thioredoxin family protein [Flavobacterium]KAF2519897.1 thioredoxin family protein [Flavobacterium salilacus subsp. salilacus]MBE1614196.1 thioredoxin family protein [Flavobacterium sp. SaA2.13]